MFTWLAILCCHLLCGCGEKKSQCKSYEGKESSKKGKELGHQMMHGKTIWKPAYVPSLPFWTRCSPFEKTAPVFSFLPEISRFEMIMAWMSDITYYSIWESEKSRRIHLPGFQRTWSQKYWQPWCHLLDIMGPLQTSCFELFQDWKVWKLGSVK